MSGKKLEVSEQNIDLWMVYYDDIVDEALLANLRALLNDAEREKVERFHLADDRKRYLVTRALVRTVLSRYADVAPVDWVFSANVYGRPEIANRHEDTDGLRFNLSHTRGLIVLGVSRWRALGVDVEHLQVRQVSAGIAERFFSPAEAAELARVPSAQWQDRFFEYWTFKESYIKARGMGLTIPLDRFSFDYPFEGAVQIVIDPELGDDGGRWGLWQFRPRPEYLLAVCAERQRGEAPTLTLRKVIPTVGDEVFEAVLLKTSEGSGV